MHVSSVAMFVRRGNPLRTDKAKTKPAWPTPWGGISVANPELAKGRQSRQFVNATTRCEV
jgi:hypothetical protein